MSTPRPLVLIFILLSLLVSACSRAAQPDAQQPGKLNVAATTSIVGDVVRNVGGEAINLSVLIPAGSDPHSFEPVPQDIARAADAEVIFYNGAGLEDSLLRVIDSAGEGKQMVSLSDGIELHEPSGTEEHPEATAAVEDDEHANLDPHVWTDPTLVKLWVDKIAQVLSAKDPANTQYYQANAEHYRQALDELDGWVQEQVSQIPPENRKLVTDHQSFGYFAERYGFEQVGAIIPGYSTVAAPSAQELASLEDAVRQQGVQAIFVGKTVNPKLAERVAQDTGVQLVFLYTGSLTNPGGEASSYLDYMHNNVDAIVTALK